MNKPNILIIQTDQQARWTLGCYGGRTIETPNIDTIADQGVRFDNFFTPSAVCTPSRGCFVTGRYPHNHGAYRNGIAINSNEVTFAHILKKSGYDTAYIGKWHLAGDDYPNPGWIKNEYSMGFDDCRYMINVTHDKEVIEKEGQDPLLTRNIGDEKTYMTDWLTNKTIEYINSHEGEKPFCVMVSIPDPHQPFCVRAPYDTMYKPEDMIIPESFYEEELPDWADDDEWGRKRYFPISMKDREERLRRIKAQYCGEVKCIDDNVGKMLRCLYNKGLMDNTIIIFTTDHGEYMGEHGLLEKNNLYDSVYQIPLAIRWPEKIEAGTVIEEYVNIVDFHPTLLDLIGLNTSGREQGISAVPLLEGNCEGWLNEVFIHPNDVPRAGIITPEFELAYVGRGWKREENHEFKDHILFDRKKDPHMMNNLFYKEEYQEIIKDLTVKIRAHHEKVGTDKKYLPKALFR